MNPIMAAVANGLATGIVLALVALFLDRRIRRVEEQVARLTRFIVVDKGGGLIGGDE